MVQSTNSHTDSMESLVVDQCGHEKPGDSDSDASPLNKAPASLSDEEIRSERRLEDESSRISSSTVAVEFGGHHTAESPSECSQAQTSNTSNLSQLKSKHKQLDQVNTEVELEEIIDSDRENLLVGDSQKYAQTNKLCSWLRKMLKQLFSGFIKLIKDLKLFMRYCYT